MRFWTTGWALGQVGVGGGVPHHPPDSLMLAVTPRHRQACWVVGRVAELVLSPALIAQPLIWSHLLPLQVSKLRIRETIPHRPEHRALPEIGSSEWPLPTLPRPSRASSPCTIHPLFMFVKLCRPRGKMRPRAPQGREPHTSRWPSQEGTFFYISPHPESESGMQKPTPS